jgi:hypothetical protein
VLLLNSRASAGASNHYPAKYGKLAYSTHFPPNVIPVNSGYGPDSLPILTADGRRFGQRVHTHHSGAAPGFIWSAFAEVVNDEPQAMTTAVLVWRDVQVVLAVVHPALPVSAYHAPAPLGVERAAGLVRRSDPTAGWEYAEGEGRAVAIRRLLGYDAQQPSAPWLGRSTLNLAYAYAEHPLVYESQPSLAPRALASVVLARPAPFDPAEELAGFSVTERGGEFSVTGPDGALAFVALGAALPASVRLGALAFHGEALRYARCKPDGQGCAGQGVTRVPGIVTFDAPATFQLERQPDGGLTLLTDIGAVLAPACLGAAARTVTVRTLAGDWQPVPECSSGALPTLVVQAWQQRTEHQLVKFRWQ